MPDFLDDDIESPPPTAPRVAARGQVLTVQGYRAAVEQGGADPVAEQALRDCIAWCERVGLRDEFEPEEWEILVTPFGRLPLRRQVDASWRIEGAMVLAWALGLCELPDSGQQIAGVTVADALAFLSDEAASLRQRAVLRPVAELERHLDECITLHWRLRQFSIAPAAIDFVDFAARCQWVHMRLDRLHIVDRDLAVGGVPLSKAPEPEWRLS